MKTSTVLSFISALLILLYVYTAVSKWMDFNQFKAQMYQQALPVWLAHLLIFTLPGTELFTAMLLLFNRTQLTGYYLSAVLLFVFTGYVALVVFHFFDRVPCSCGGVIRGLGWEMHLLFNVFFLLLTILAINLHNRERRGVRFS
jgi:putative oxidoreductase